MVKLKIVFVWMLLIFSLNVDAETTCTRDYGGKIVLGECWYVKDGSYYKLAQLSDFTWEGGYEGYFLLDAYDLDEPFMIKIKPYFRIAGNTYTPADIHNTYPNYDMSEIINTVDNHKFGLNITQIPTVIQNNLEYVVFHLEDVYGVNWDDVELLGNGRIRLKDLILDYNDLKEEGYTINLYNKTTLLIGNVSGRETLFLDPIISFTTPNTQNLDDSEMWQIYPTNNYGTYEQMDLQIPGSYQDEGIIKFNITALPGGQDVLEANLSVLCYEYFEVDEVGNLSVRGINNTYVWNEGSITWNSRPTTQLTPVLDSKLIGDGESTFIRHTLDVTSIIQEGYINSWENVSLYLSLYNSANLDSDTEDALRCYTKEYGNSAWRPILSISYSEAVGGDCWDGLTDAGDFVLDDGSTCVITEDLTDAGGDIFVRGDSTLILEANLFFDEGNILLWEGGGKILLNGGFPIINLN